MRRLNTQSIGEVIREIFEDNTEIYEKIMDVRIQRAWQKLLGPMVMQYMRNMYVKDRILYVYMNSAVLRSELLLCKDKLLKSLNGEVGSAFLFDLIIR